MPLVAPTKPLIANGWVRATAAFQRPADPAVLLAIGSSPEVGDQALGRPAAYAAPGNVWFVDRSAGRRCRRRSAMARLRRTIGPLRRKAAYPGRKAAAATRPAGWRRPAPPARARLRTRRGPIHRRPATRRSGRGKCRRRPGRRAAPGASQLLWRSRCPSCPLKPGPEGLSLGMTAYRGTRGGAASCACSGDAAAGGKNSCFQWSTAWAKAWATSISRLIQEPAGR